MNLIKNFYSSKVNNFKIYLFHGVIKKENYKIRNYNGKHMHEKKFIKIIKLLKKNGNIMSLDEIIFNINNNQKLPKNTYAITFDDGFENNFSVAAPILSDYKIPTTFYFTTDFIESNSMSWIDKIEYCLEKIKYGSIKLPWKKNEFFFNNSKKKINLLNSIRKNVKKNFKINTNEFVNYFYNNFKLDIPKISNSEIDRKISWKQVIKLKNNYLFNIGGHSHNHISLGSLSSKEVDYQLNRSFYLFKKKAKINLQHYSYPEGQKIDFNNSIIKKLKRKNIKCCPTAILGTNTSKTDFFNLKRIAL